LTPAHAETASGAPHLQTVRGAAQPPSSVIPDATADADRGYAELPRHLIAAGDLTRAAAIAILDTAERIDQAIAGREVRKLPTLRGRTVVNLFYEDSTRTRISFELAAKRLSADVINFSAKGSSVSKGESLKDTALTLQSMGADAVVIRHSASGAPERLTNWINGTVINAGDGTHEHPTQALLDAFTLRRHLVGPGGGAGGNVTGGGAGGDVTAGGGAGGIDERIGRGLDGKRVVIVGDILHSRVARSNVALLHTLGAHVTLVAPPTLLPVGVEEWPCAVSYDFDAALTGVDAAMMLRVQHERMDGAFFPTAREYTRGYGLDLRRRALIAPHGIVMHPGPMNRGMEIAPAVADGDSSVVTEQVANGVTVRMAVLYLLVSGEGADRV
jgi:aspartate carbamoyltransferase catalytic subunit